MAGSQKEFELLFKLKASLGGNFNSTFKGAIETQRQLQNSIKSVNSMQSKVDGYTRTSNAIEQQRGKLERLQAEHEKVSQKIQAHQTNAERLRAKIEETGDATGELTAQLVREENEVAKNTERLKSNENQIRQTTASIHSQEEQLERMAQELRDAGIDTDNLEESNARLQRSYERLRGSQENLNRINSEQAKIKENIAATKTQLLGTIGAIGAVTAAIYAGPVQAAQEYETAIAKVSTIADANAVPIEEMSSEIMKLSNTTGIAASQIADDVYNAISAGQQTGDAVNFVSYSTKLAKAGFAESAQTLDVLTTILNAYGMEAEEVSKVSDMLVQTQNKGKVSVGELSSVMGKIIPTANANNVALEQLCAGYAIMTSKGIAAAETTTYMNSMLNELSKSGTTAEKTLRATTGKSFKELMTEGKSLGEVIQILQQEAEKSGKSLNDMFGSAEAGKAAVSLLSGGVEGFNEQVAGMVDSVGATEEAFAKMDQTTEAKMQKAKNSIANLGIVLGQNLLPIVGNLADKVAAVVVKVSEFAQANPKLVQTALKVAAALAGMKVAGLTAKLGFLHISSGIKDAQKILELFKIKAIGLSGIGSKVVGFITKPFSGIGGILGKALSGIGGIVARSPLGSIGRVVASSFGKIGSFIAPVGNIIKKALGPLGKIGSTLLGPLGGIAGKFLPVVGVITAVITAVQLLRKHFDKVREAVGKIFGEKGLEIFDKIVAVVTSVGETIKGVFSDGNLGAARDKIQEIFGEKGVAVFDTFAGVFQKVVAAAGQFVGFVTTHIVPVVEQVLNVLITTVIPGIISGVQAAAPVVMEVFQAIADFIGGIIPIIGDFIAGIMPVISEVITFIQTYVLPIVGEVFNFIVQQVLPFIVQGIQQLGSIITTVLQAVLPVVQTVFTTIWNIIQPILQQVLTTVQAVLPAVLSIFQNVFNTIGGIISAVQQVLSGIIQFITGVFSGNWSQAWEGIKSIFSGVWDGILSICKGVINGITGAVNVVIRGLNSLKVPDWVPGIGGKGINIPEIPQLAKGSKSTPDTFIAGEAGPELITNAPGRTVYTAQQTKDIFSAQNAAAQVAQAAGAGQTASQVFYNTTNNAPEVKPPEVVSGAGAGGGNNITITNSPTIYVDSDKAGDLEEKLEENNRNLLQEVEDLLDKRNDDERRSRHE
ncbi:phage tail tape measure protein [Enterocloster bolteae]|uniref:phage tail tape measure protein n=2 Tax=Lachnospiraceae TaxID=186803 RepID=UPI00148DC0F6|nr:phage tail tape measure protein [uncultured Acetatifactor sp.]QJU19012.1 phage tail tape measure protein [Enterocloster bolteae]